MHVCRKKLKACFFVYCMDMNTGWSCKFITQHSQMHNAFLDTPYFLLVTVSVLDPCQSLACLNGAACTALDCSTRQCQCTDCFQGDNCGMSKYPVTNITL